MLKRGKISLCKNNLVNSALQLTIIHVLPQKLKRICQKSKPFVQENCLYNSIQKFIICGKCTGSCKKPDKGGKWMI